MSKILWQICENSIFLELITWNRFVEVLFETANQIIKFKEKRLFDIGRSDQENE